MHGEVNPHESRLSGQAIQQELNLLQNGVKALLKPQTAPHTLPSGAVNALIEQMVSPIEETGNRIVPDNRTLPCAYTYFGQLLAHDITSHRSLGVSLPTLRLQTLYGLGPMASPQFYQHGRDPDTEFAFRAVKFVLDKYALAQPNSRGEVVHDFPRVNTRPSGDDPRRTSGVPLMADARNDQNFIISQMTVLFQRLHNHLADIHFSKDKSKGQMFAEASRSLVHLYQRVLLTDYLPRILCGGEATVKDLVQNNNFLIFTGKKDECRLSEVFSRAALRYGHSQVRQMYQVQMNRSINHLFGSDLDLRGFVRDTRRKVDWACLLAEKNRKAFQPAKAFDTNIVLALNNLPFLPKGERSLIEKNLENSLLNFSVPDFLADVSANGSQGLKAMLNAYSVNTSGWEVNSRASNDAGKEVPLWAYLLLEAEQHGNGGKTLGPLGSQIVAEQIVWILKEDAESVLGSQGTTWSKALTLRELMQMADPAIAGHLQTLEAEHSVIHATSHKPAQVQTATLAPLTEPPTSNRFHYFGTEVGLNYRLAANGQIEQEKSDGIWVRVSLTDKPNPDGYNFVSERASLLQNGFHWYPGTESDSAVSGQIAAGTLFHHSKKKREIRVYISRHMILQHCGTAPTGTGNSDVKGIFFIFARKVNGELFLMARPTGSKGEAVLVNGAYPWDSTDATITVDNTNAAGFSNAFVANQYSVFKDNGLVPQTIALTKLLKIMGYSQADADAAAGTKTVEISLISVQGEDLARGENYGLAPLGDNPEDDDYRSTTFFALALKSGSEATGDLRINGSGRPYPPNCYVESATWR